MIRPWAGIVEDAAFACRMLVKERRVTIAAAVVLSLAIGVNNSVFTLINTALIRELPFHEADRLIAIRPLNPRGPAGVSFPDYQDFQTSTRAFERLAAETSGAMNVIDEGRAPERYRGTYVSAHTFEVLRAQPVLGRTFRADDDQPGSAGVVILGHGIWQNRYGGDRAIVGRTIRVNDAAAIVIGVMPPGFTYPFIADAWQPLSLAPTLARDKRDVRNLSVIGRLAPGVELAQARAEIDRVATQLARERPASREPVRPTVIPLRDAFGRIARPMLLTFMGAVVFVLLIACANLAGLLLTRARARSREMAIRAALGATGWRIARQLLIECLMLAALGGLGGVAFSIYGAQAIAIAFNPIEAGAPLESTRPFWVNLSMNGVAYGFVALICLFATLAIGALPALYASRIDLNDVLKRGGRGSIGGGSLRWSGTLLVGQLALTSMLLFATGLLWRSYVVLYQTDLRFDTSNVISARLTLPPQRYATPAARLRFFDQLQQRLVDTPISAAATVATGVPFEVFGPSRDLAIDRQPTAAQSTVRLLSVGADYFDALRVPVVRGRPLTANDALPGEPPVVVDERFVGTFVADGDALGRRITLTGTGPGARAPRGFVIVGVAATVPQIAGPAQFAKPVVYVPLAADDATLAGTVTVFVRANADVGDTGVLSAAISSMRDAVRQIDPSLPLYAIETLDASVARARYVGRLVGTWLGVIALIAIVLASVGLYSVTAHAVTGRTLEIGIRLALGAARRDVVWLFLRRSVAQLVAGLALGLAGAMAAGTLLSAYLRQIGPRDPLTFVAVCGVIVLVVIVASLMPARRAATVDPSVTLRAE